MAGVSLRGAVLLAALAASFAGASTASASELLTARIASTKSAFRACSDRPATGKAGNVQRNFTAPKLGWVNAKLDGSGGDWDLTVFDAKTNRLVAGDSSFGADEVASGYPSSALRKKLSKKTRKRYTARKGILILTSSKKFKVGKLRVGSSARSLRRGLRVGRNVWYTKKGAKARLVYKVRRKKIYEVGIADRTLTRSRSAQKRFFKSFH